MFDIPRCRDDEGVCRVVKSLSSSSLSSPDPSFQSTIIHRPSQQPSNASLSLSLFFLLLRSIYNLSIIILIHLTSIHSFAVTLTVFPLLSGLVWFCLSRLAIMKMYASFLYLATLFVSLSAGEVHTFEKRQAEILASLPSCIQNCFLNAFASDGSSCSPVMCFHSNIQL